MPNANTKNAIINAKASPAPNMICQRGMRTKRMRNCGMHATSEIDKTLYRKPAERCTEIGWGGSRRRAARQPLLSAGLGEAGGRAVDGGPAAVDEEGGARDVARGVRGKKGDAGRNLARFAPAVEHGVGGERLIDVRPRLQGGDQRRLDDARHDRVHAHAEAADLGGKPAHHLDDAGFGSAVNREPRLKGRSAYRGTRDQAAAAVLPAP